MGISLFEHNRIAYESAVSLLAETGRAAIIHPTGTGKSYIAFQLAEENPDSVVCWLSPSEYIFKTQTENLQRNGDGRRPENILFFTYAKLMMMEPGEMAEIQPDYIILDEFHRCGAEMWGRGVAALLKLYSEAPVLGLSATSIRYLDNQRDMAEELFSGNIASEMTLGEAIVRGILPAPKYITAIYHCGRELKKYEACVRSAKNKAVRDAGERYLEALRRALDKAHGLDAVFQKHMTQRQGKYILFCSNAIHMQEMISHAAQWFGKIDPKAHIYKAYSDDPETARAFAQFKADESPRLKLLFCIDMLNEGVHVEGISGVILFRHTVSPIIYKQQIGRALSAGAGGEPVIIDVVNNIENLYSIGAVQEEMEEAVNYYRFVGGCPVIVNETFTIIDEARECRRLFDRLEETLAASWDLMYGYAKKYHEANGRLDVPKRYKTPEGYSLGHWLNTQRLVRAGKTAGCLTKEQIAKLDAIAMRWESRYDDSWERNYKAVLAYKAEKGSLDIPADYVSPEGLLLGKWISNLRQMKASGKRGYYLTEKRQVALDSLGMIWDKPDYLWEQNYLACAGYYMKHGNLEIPSGYVTADGLRVGSWIHRMRKIRSGRMKGCAPLTPEQIRRLDAIAMDWQDAFTKRWEYGYEQAVKYREAFGSLDVPAAYINEAGFPLGKWLRRHVDRDSKTGKPSIKVTADRRERLDALGMKWEAEDPWEKRLCLCREYYEKHGDLNVPPDYVAQGVWLGKWLYNVRRIYRGQTEAKSAEKAPEKNFDSGLEVRSEKGSEKGLEKGPGKGLETGLEKAGEKATEGKALTPRQISQLEAVGMDWTSSSERNWQKHYEALRRYAAANGHANAPISCPTEDGLWLGRWAKKQISLYRNGRLSREQIRLLADIGLIKKGAVPLPPENPRCPSTSATGVV